MGGSWWGWDKWDCVGWRWVVMGTIHLIRLAEDVLQRSSVRLVKRGEEGVRCTSLASSASAADPVDIVLNSQREGVIDTDLVGGVGFWWEGLGRACRTGLGRSSK